MIEMSGTDPSKVMVFAVKMVQPLILMLIVSNHIKGKKFVPMPGNSLMFKTLCELGKIQRERMRFIW